MANQGKTGTGKHGHKDTQEPFPHTKESGRQHEASRGSGGSHQQHGGGSSGSSQAGSQDPSLKSREYRDADGNVHHHTKGYMEDHRGGSGGKR